MSGPGQRVLWLGLGFLLACGAFFTWRLPGGAGVEDRPRPRRATTAAAAIGSAGGAADTPAPECYLGIVQAREAVDVTADAAARLEQVQVRPGDSVARGELLASLDTRQLEHQLAIERSALRRASAQLRQHALEAERAEEAHRRHIALGGLVSDSELKSSRFESAAATAGSEAAAAEVAAARARIAQLETRLASLQIRAPFDGRVARRYLDAGAGVAAGTPIVRLIGSEALLSRFAVPPEAVIPLGALVRVEIEGPRRQLAGTVEHVAPEIDTASQMVFVEALIRDPGNLTVTSGATARVSLVPDGPPPASCFAEPESLGAG